MDKQTEERQGKANDRDQSVTLDLRSDTDRFYIMEGERRGMVRTRLQFGKKDPSRGDR